MTRDEVIRALTCCLGEGKREPANCSECPNGSQFRNGCIRKLMREALRELKKG